MIFCVCVVISSLVIVSALKEIAYNQHLAASSVNIEQNNGEWEVIAVDESHIILFNPYSGEYFTRFITDEDWSNGKGSSPYLP